MTWRPWRRVLPVVLCAGGLLISAATGQLPRPPGGAVPPREPPPPPFDRLEPDFPLPPGLDPVEAASERSIREILDSPSVDETVTVRGRISLFIDDRRLVLDDGTGAIVVEGTAVADATSVFESTRAEVSGIVALERFGSGRPPRAKLMADRVSPEGETGR